MPTPINVSAGSQAIIALGNVKYTGRYHRQQQRSDFALFTRHYYQQ